MSITVTDDPLMEEINKKTQRCFGCNSCTSGCPVFKVYPQFKPANLARELFLYKRAPVYKDQPAFWLCSSCLSCSAVCPQDVDISHIFYKLKSWSIENNVGVPENIINEAKMMKTGKTVPESSAILKRRADLGLPELPKPDLEELDRVLKHSGFTKKLDNLIVMEGDES